MAEPPSSRPRGRALVVTDPVILIRQANDRLVMMREGKVAAAIPIADLSHVAIHGPVTLTGAAIARLLDAGLDISLHTSGGRWRGLIASAQSKNVYLLLAQADTWRRPERRLAFARAILASKLRGQRELLKRHALDHGSSTCDEAARQITALAPRLAGEPDLDALRGVEGAASAAYFAVFGEVVGGAWSFRGRVRRPPTDPVNALLSFGYTLAGSELARQLVRGGIDPRIGLLHGLRYGRESLPLDLVEELRAPLVDRFTVNLLHRRQMTADDFETREDGAVRMTDAGRRRYLELWEEMLSTRAPLLGRAGEEPEADSDSTTIAKGDKRPPAGVTWRQRMERQVRRLQRFLLQGEPYRPLLTWGKRRVREG